MKRRNFLQKSFAGMALTSFNIGEETQSHTEGESMDQSLSYPVLLATWDFGLPAVNAGYDRIKQGGSALDAVEIAAVVTENDPDITSVGYGGYPNSYGRVQLDAAIIDGKTGRMGAVGALENIRNPISVARKVLEDNRHLFLVGEGAKLFALQHGFEEQNLLTPKALQWYTEKMQQDEYEPQHDTIGTLALDTNGDMAVSCTTSGLGMKLPGRVGDSPIIGAGLYLDAEVGGATATGVGERCIEVCGSFAIVELMRNGRTPQEACEEVVRRVVKRNTGKPGFQLAFIALNRKGEHGAAAVQEGFNYALCQNGQSKLLTGKVFGRDFE